jgi:RNA polymerase sigma-70 factor, ECF subfamily
MMADSARSLESKPPDEFRDQMLALIPSLRAFARGLCRNRDLADDLAQEAMARAWAARDNFTLGTNFRAWMFMIVRNQYYTSLRKNSRIVAWDPEAAERLLVTPATQHVGLDLQDLERAMGKLPVEQREMLLLVAANGMSYEEAAQITGCALGTVKSRIARARASLVQAMEGNDDTTAKGASVESPKIASAGSG